MWMLALSLLSGCSTPSSGPSEPAVRSVDAAELKAALDAGQVPILLDVRTAGEYAAGHVPGAVNLPIDELDARTRGLEPLKAGDVYLICQWGGRSARAAAALAGAGYHPVDVEGGTAAWRSAGLPIEGAGPGSQ